jgi:hypothetical protein
MRNLSNPKLRPEGPEELNDKKITSSDPSLFTNQDAMPLFPPSILKIAPTLIYIRLQTHYRTWREQQRLPNLQFHDIVEDLPRSSVFTSGLPLCIQVTGIPMATTSLSSN